MFDHGGDDFELKLGAMIPIVLARQPLYAQHR